MGNTSGNIKSALSKFLSGTHKGLRFFWVQLLVWCVIDVLLAPLSLGPRGMQSMALGIGLMMCMVAYTMLFGWYFSFVPLKRGLKRIYIPYLIYAAIVYLGIVEGNDWNFRRVTIDDYMLMGWLAPLYGLFVLKLERKIKKKLGPYHRLTRVISKLISLSAILFVIVVATLAVGSLMMN